MDRKNLFKVIKLGNLLIGITITIVAAIVLFNNPTRHQITLSCYTILGAWLGISLNHFFILPRVFMNKDERELVIQIVSMYLGVSIGFVICIVLIALTSVGTITITFTTYVVVVLGIAIIIGAVKKIAYQLMLNWL